MIKAQEAIDYLRDPICVGLSTKEKLKPHEEAFNMAVEALEKQVPQKTGIPELGIDGKKIIPCGNCGSELESRIWSFCPRCGQAIDWGENG